MLYQFIHLVTVSEYISHVVMYHLKIDVANYMITQTSLFVFSTVM